MGTEIIYPIAWLVSIVASIWLIVRPINPDSRPFALPTLLASFVVALLWALASHKPGFFWAYASMWFAPASVVLGTHAYAIKWLVRRRVKITAA